jgi:hypothetical protein
MLEEILGEFQKSRREADKPPVQIFTKSVAALMNIHDLMNELFSSSSSIQNT